MGDWYAEGPLMELVHFHLGDKEPRLEEDRHKGEVGVFVGDRRVAAFHQQEFLLHRGEREVKDFISNRLAFVRVELERDEARKLAEEMVAAYNKSPLIVQDFPAGRLPWQAEDQKPKGLEYWVCDYGDNWPAAVEQRLSGEIDQLREAIRIVGQQLRRLEVEVRTDDQSS